MTHATVTGVLGRILAICLGLTTACYSPPQPDCGFTCGQNGECPADYFCAGDGICHREGTPATLACAVDARPDSPRPIDAPPPDADTTAPALFASMPADGDTNVPLATTIRVQFTEPVVNVTTASFQVASGSTVIAGTVSTIDPLSYVFAPTSTLPAASTIEVVLTAAISDSAGNGLAPGTTFSFTTAN